MARTMALLPRVDQAWRAAVQHVRQLPQPESERAMQELFQLTQHYGGWGILLQKEAGVAGPVPPPTTRRWPPGGNSSNRPVPTGQDSGDSDPLSAATDLSLGRTAVRCTRGA